MPTVGSPNAESDDMAQGLQQLGQGIGQMIGGKRKWERDQAIRDLAQENWERNFAQQKAQSDRNFALQQQQFDLTKAAKEQEMARQRQQDEWLKQFYEQYFGNDPEVTELQKLLAKYQRPTEDSMFMAGLNPLLMK
jgi:hypothetical protein